ncbi:myo-inositol-1-phosphate synthase [Murinocardiopsis flavida]|uniref:Myo-inositol-1-phosphate synthase n=1 Tax=Murinocardiopsis flavida TaxID=645275 RepID=A0A2P8DLG6_9ACTN|nr:inositol-3-phosphate synthase [Murinocardiopsis flavida]PSK98048.1 myo-inositol-1-phosphate synthase [Murinocardiopsis flavida]
MHTPPHPRTGVWLIGARGSVATTAIAGAAALRTGAPATAMVTEAPGFPADGLPRTADLVFGGHDIAHTTLAKRAEQLAAAGVLPAGLPDRVRAELDAADARIRPGVPQGHGSEHPADGLRRLAADIAAFRTEERLDRVVVVNVADTEAPAPARAETEGLDALTAALESGAHVLPASSRYAHAAFTAGCAYVNFTPSAGARPPAIAELAARTRLPYAGDDGKTGETLLKSVLAPMFGHRHLRVRSWAGTNLLGGGDGANLADPAVARSKLDSKSRLVGELLGYPVDDHLHIDHVADLAERKVAWDHVTFDGFLGAQMSLQFTWQGYDSALAAPLVLDLARLMARAHETGRSGPVTELAFFFKDPLDCAVHDLPGQHAMLLAFAERLRRAGGPA